MPERISLLALTLALGLQGCSGKDVIDYRSQDRVATTGVQDATAAETSGQQPTTTTTSTPTDTSTSPSSPTSDDDTPTTDNQTPEPAPDTTNGRVLNMGTVFNQYSTNWCWGYAMFHSLRTIYVDSTASDADSQAWKDALNKLNNPEAFKSFMGQRYQQKRLGMPDEFLLEFQNTYALQSQANKWTLYFASNGYSEAESAFEDNNAFAPTGVSRDRSLNKKQLLAKAEEKLKEGIPPLYCTKEHCMVMYGYKINGNSRTYYVADSIGGRTYTHSESQVLNVLSFMMMK